MLRLCFLITCTHVFGLFRMWLLTEFLKFSFVVEAAELQFRPLHPVRIDGDDASKVEKLYELLQVCCFLCANMRRKRGMLFPFLGRIFRISRFFFNRAPIYERFRSNRKTQYLDVKRMLWLKFQLRRCTGTAII